MGGGWLLPILNLLTMGGGPVTDSTTTATVTGSWRVPTSTGAWEVPTSTGSWEA